MAEIADSDITIGQAAARWPHLIPFFELHRMDYCCKGDTPLRSACQYAGVDLADVAQETLCTPPSEASHRNWARATMTELSDYIVSTYHEPTRQRLGLLESMITNVVTAHAEKAPWLHDLSHVLSELRREMLDHMIREERVLFPWMKRLELPHEVNIGPPWSVRRPIDCMIHDHDVVSAAFVRIRGITSNYSVPDWACASARRMIDQLRVLEAETHVHIHLENNILFPAAVDAESRDPRSRSSALPHEPHANQRL